MRIEPHFPQFEEANVGKSDSIQVMNEYFSNSDRSAHRLGSIKFVPKRSKDCA
jgi:hypothetical protein